MTARHSIEICAMHGYFGQPKPAMGPRWLPEAGHWVWGLHSGHPYPHEYLPDGIQWLEPGRLSVVMDHIEYREQDALTCRVTDAVVIRFTDPHAFDVVGGS